MGRKFTRFLMSFIICCIVFVFILFGIIFFKEIYGDLKLVSVEPEKFKSNITTTSTVQKNITAPVVMTNSSGVEDTTSVKNVNYDSVTVDKYYYNQLNNYSQDIYKAFESNKEQMKTGKAQIDLGTNFSNLLSTSQGQNQLSQYYQSAIEAYTYDNPDVFYLNPNKMYLNVETITSGSQTKYNVYINSGNEASYLIDEFSSKTQVQNAIASVEQVKNQIEQSKTGNAYDDIKMVHDYLIDNIEYDSSISKPNIYNIYGALVNKVCVCEGYARALKYILDDMGISTVLVIGQGVNNEGQTENHAWDYVRLSGSWYAIDATWDDPIVVGGGTATQKDRYRYFLKGSSEFNQDHSPSGQFTEGGMVFSYPNLSSSSFSK